MPQVIKTRKIKLIPVAESTQDKKEIYKYIKKVASDLSQAGNKVVRVHILNQFEIENNITEKGLKPQEANELLKKKLGGSIENSGYQTLSEFSHISSNIRN